LKNKPPLFFCDNCGAEVSDNNRACPNCGRYFTSVRCPACNFSGEEELFGNGCPVCGYSESGGRKNPVKTAVLKKQKKQKRPAPPAVEPLPAPVYIGSILALIAVMAILAYLLTR
jgi:uncharacterized membrane protein YvbJ